MKRLWLMLYCFIPGLAAVFPCNIWFSSSAYASSLSPQLTLFHYDEQALHPHWAENGHFARLLEKDVQDFCIAYDEGHVMREFTFQLHSVTRKLRITFTPKIIIKPFILVEELQALFFVYHSQKSNDIIPIDENFQLKRASLMNAVNQIKKLLNKRSSRSLSLSPYYNRIYGLHLQIYW